MRIASGRFGYSDLRRMRGPVPVCFGGRSPPARVSEISRSGAANNLKHLRVA